MKIYEQALVSSSIYKGGNKFVIYSSHYGFFKKYLRDGSPGNTILLNTPLHEVGKLDELLVRSRSQLTADTTILFVSNTAESIKKSILAKYRPPFNRCAYLFHFLYHRVFSKFSKVTGQIYNKLSVGRARVLHSSEILGQISFHGYSIIEYCFEKNMFLVAAKKSVAENEFRKVSKGLIFSMLRIGKGGKLIKVYKLRTMHPYSECLQEFMMKRYGLEDDGKFRNDFRVASWGKVLRKYWIDELPMLFNLLKGDIKLVGVRPISSKYFQLYPDDVKELRLKTKPGFIPPSYAFSVRSLEEIIQFEKKYLEEYLQNPVATDIRYFFMIMAKMLSRKISSR